MKKFIISYFCVYVIFFSQQQNAFVTGRTEPPNVCSKKSGSICETGWFVKKDDLWKRMICEKGRYATKSWKSESVPPHSLRDANICTRQKRGGAKRGAQLMLTAQSKIQILKGQTKLQCFSSLSWAAEITLKNIDLKPPEPL